MFHLNMGTEHRKTPILDRLHSSLFMTAESRNLPHKFVECSPRLAWLLDSLLVEVLSRLFLLRWLICIHFS